MKLEFSNRIAAMQPSAIREILKATADPNIIPFAAGNPAPEAFPAEAIAKFSAEILETNPIGALQYSLSEGYPLLRETLRVYMKEHFNIGREFDDINIMSGAQQVMDYTAKVLLNEGDTVICENPTFIGTLNTFRSYALNLVGLPMEDDGIRPEDLEAAILANPNTKLIYLIPTFQNPSGRTMSLAKRKAVYEIAVKHNILILEDNPYGELRFEGETLPTIKSLDEKGVVIYAGSFSKVVSPGMRVGFAVAHKDILSKMTIAKQCNDVHTNISAQMVIHKLLTEFDFPAHLERLRGIYRRKCNLMLNALDEKMPTVKHTLPSGGLFVWCDLPEGIDIHEFTQEALAAGVAIVPGNNFFVDSNMPTQSVRLNYSTPTDEQLVKGVDILAKILNK